MSKEKGCKCCKLIWYEDMLDKKWKLCPNCYEYCKPLIDDLKIKDKKITDLQSQLAEHNEYFRSFSCENFNEFQDFISTFMLTPHEEQALIRELKQQLAEKEKEQNQKAIEQLEKVKDYFIEGYAVCKNFSDFYWNFTEQIDNQINELKELK